MVTIPTVVEPVFPVDLKPFEEAGSNLVEAAKEIASGKGIDQQTRLGKAFGNPAQETLRVAEEREFDLIVIGAKGHSLLRDLMAGSVCDAVVRSARCPVLVVR